MEQAYDRLVLKLNNAAARIGEEYFQLPVADTDAVYRERVYCYELYHQLRSGWDDFPFCLGGEIDKSGNPHFRGGPYAGAQPDLLVHVPGNMDDNLAVIEVKSANVGLGAIRADLQKLAWFCQNARYFRGIFIVYGESGDGERMAAKIRRAAPDLNPQQIVCAYHRRAGDGMEVVEPWRPEEGDAA